MTGKAGRTVRSAVAVFVGRAGVIALWFYAMVLINARLGKTGAGVFALCVAFIKSTSSFLGESVDLTILRRVPEYLRSDRPRAIAILQAGVWLRLAIALGIAVAVVPLAPWLAREFLGSVAWSPLVLVAVAGILGDLLFRSLLGYLQAAEAFSRYVLAEAALQLLRFTGIVALVLAGVLTPSSSLATYVGASFLVLALGIPLLPRDALRAPRSGRREVLDLFHQSKWMMAALAAAALAERLEYFQLASYRGAAEVGIYHAALTLALLPDLVCSSLMTVFQPKTVRLYRAGQFGDLSRRFLSWSLPLCGAAILGAFLLGGEIVDFVYHGRYAESAPVFVTLAAGKLAFLAVATLPMSLVALVAPGRMLRISLLQLALKAAGGAVLIPRLGSLGAASLVSGVQVAIAILLLREAARVLRERPPVPGEKYVQTAGPSPRHGADAETLAERLAAPGGGRTP